MSLFVCVSFGGGEEGSGLHYFPTSFSSLSLPTSFSLLLTLEIGQGSLLHLCYSCTMVGNQSPSLLKDNFLRSLDAISYLCEHD